MRRLPPVLLALMLLTGCGAWETEAALSLPKTVPAKPISAPAVVTEGRKPTKDYDLPTEVVRQLEWGERMGKPVAKLAELPEQDAAFYAVEEDSSYWALLRWGGSLAEFDWSFGGPLIVEPRLWCRDVDGDGQEEIVLVNHVGSGTGVSIEELHIVEKNLDGTLTDYAFPEELWQEDLSSLLDTAVTADRTFAVLGEELGDITRQLPENLDPEVLRGLGTGSVARFDTDWPDSGGIRFNGSACLDADGYYYWYVADISAYVSYAGGVFTLSDFHLNGNE